MHGQKNVKPKDAKGLERMRSQEHKKTEVCSWQSVTHLFPVVEDNKFAVLIVDCHSALVALTCKQTPRGNTSEHTQRNDKLYTTIAP